VSIIIEIEKIPATIPTTIKEAQSLLSEMGEIPTREAHQACQLEAQLAIAQQELYQTLAREMPAQKSRIVLSSACHTNEADFQTTCRAQEKPTTQPKRKRTRKAGGERSVKRGQRKY
jgi:hypothetical protein